jgi:hypothetical protein
MALHTEDSTGALQKQSYFFVGGQAELVSMGSRAEMAKIALVPAN